MATSNEQGVEYSKILSLRSTKEKHLSNWKQHIRHNSVKLLAGSICLISISTKVVVYAVLERSKHMYLRQ
jgi:hypothetical protein